MDPNSDMGKVILFMLQGEMPGIILELGIRDPWEVEKGPADAGYGGVIFETEIHDGYSGHVAIIRQPEDYTIFLGELVGEDEIFTVTKATKNVSHETLARTLRQLVMFDETPLA